MLAYLETLLLAAFALLRLCGSAPTPHHAWLPLSEWGQSEPSLASWDYLGLGDAYPLQHRVDSHESWFPQPAPPTIEIVRTYRKPVVDPSAWAQIPVIGGGRGGSRHFVALVPRGFEDFVLVRKPFVVVEEADQPATNNKNGSKEVKDSTKDDDDNPKDKKDRPKNDDKSDESAKTPEPTSTTTASSTTPTTTSTSTTTPSTPPADEADNAASTEDESQPQQTKNRPQK